MKYLSVCSGIEAATAAWHPLGWQAAGFSEIDSFARAVLAHHYPAVPLHGDFTTLKENDYDAIDLLVGGTPCQSFSIAGLRKGFDDDRGNLALEFIRLAQKSRARWLVWENVPGVLSIDRGRAFGAFLGGLAECGYGFAYRILDAQYFGVPQRRRRVFVIGYLGDWRRAAAVLFESESVRGDITPCREAWQEVAGTFKSRSTSGGWGQDVDLASGGYMRVAGTLGARTCRSIGAQDADCGHLIARTLMGGANKQDPELETFVIDKPATIPINTQLATRHQALGKNTGLGVGEAGDPAFTLQAAHSHAVAYNITFCDTNGRRKDRPDGGLYVNETELAKTVTAGGDLSTYIAPGGGETAIRRLTPRECERLQGFPDDYTLVPHRGKPAADGSRYKALGNSMAVPVMRWLGERIQMIETMPHVQPNRITGDACEAV
jgi:DNA (cytosine-5)-methyltransferase 1